MGNDDTPESALFTQSKGKASMKERRQEEGPARRTNKQQQQGSSSKVKGKSVSFPPCPHCNKAKHAADSCWFRPNVQFRIADGSHAKGVQE